MPDPDNNSINRQPIIVNLRKGKGHMTDNMTQGTVLERLLYHCTTWNNHKNNIMKREKEFKEYLRDKCIDLTSCIRTYMDYDLRITEVLEILEELDMPYQASSNEVDEQMEFFVTLSLDKEKNTGTIDYDTFFQKYWEYSNEREPEHYLKDDNGNMVRVEIVCVKAGKENMIMTWKDTETGKMFRTIE